MKYEIHHRRWIDTPTSYQLVGQCQTLDEARAARIVSGDLVVFAKSKKIVPSDEWLWDWERADPQAYAHRAMKSGV